jgi:hypothetical protein
MTRNWQEQDSLARSVSLYVDSVGSNNQIAASNWEEDKLLEGHSKQIIALDMAICVVVTFLSFFLHITSIIISQRRIENP